MGLFIYPNLVNCTLEMHEVCHTSQSHLPEAALPNHFKLLSNVSHGVMSLVILVHTGLWRRTLITKPLFKEGKHASVIEMLEHCDI